MQFNLLFCLMIIATGSVLAAAKEPELPPCPSNIEYFPQNLPMHCRLTRSVIYAKNSEKVTGIPGAQAFIQNSDDQPKPIAIPMPAAFPMAPMPMMPMPQPLPHKLPVIVMPFYSPDPHFRVQSKARIKKKKKEETRKKRRNRRPSDSDSSDTDNDSSDTESDTSSDTDSDDSDSDSSDEGFWKSNRGFRRSIKRLKNRKKKNIKANKQLVTPMIQYVTKDGYVIFEKKITDGEARDWLRLKHDVDININDDKDFGDEKNVENDIPNVGKVMADSHRNIDINNLAQKEIKILRNSSKKYYQNKANIAKKPISPQ